MKPLAERRDTREKYPPPSAIKFGSVISHCCVSVITAPLLPYLPNDNERRMVVTIYHTKHVAHPAFTTLPRVNAPCHARPANKRCGEPARATRQRCSAKVLASAAELIADTPVRATVDVRVDGTWFPGQSGLGLASSNFGTRRKVGPSRVASRRWSSES